MFQISHMQWETGAEHEKSEWQFRIYHEFPKRGKKRWKFLEKQKKKNKKNIEEGHWYYK